MFHARASVAVVAAALVAVTGCGKPEPAAPPTQAAGAGLVPVTTSSDEARREYTEGQSLADRLLLHESLEHFDKAIALDPGFGMAELGRANASASGKEFLDHLKKAVAVADTLSNGEKWLILAADAASSGDSKAQRGYLEQAVAAYPADPRVHFAMGAFLFGQQEVAPAIEHFKKANELAPDYSAPYNQMGYAYRQLGDFANAEGAFKKYVELIPGDPNPYDSYGELLLKMGRFDESIAQYRKALAIDPNFVASAIGISADLTYAGKPGEAAAELDAMAEKARSDAEMRRILFGKTALAIYGGKMDEALASLDAQYAIAEKSGDTLGMAGDLQAKGAIYVEMGKAADARRAYDQALKLALDSTLPDANKANFELFQHNNLARVALARKDVADAKKEAEVFSQAALASGRPAQARLAHELAGMIALEGKDWDTAITELEQANQQNPYNLYRLCQAYQGKGEAAKAKELCTAAATFNPLPQMPYAFIHAKAAKAAGLGS